MNKSSSVIFGLVRLVVLSLTRKTGKAYQKVQDYQSPTYSIQGRKKQFFIGQANQLQNCMYKEFSVISG